MATAKKAPVTSLVKWDTALAARAKLAKKAEESVSTGSFISLKSGVMSYNGNPVAGNKMAVVVIDSVMENKFYEGKYDPGNTQPPACYAFGRSDEDMAPHEKVPNPVSDMCEGCPNNEWDTGEGGRGKACKNIRRLALISADALDDGADGVKDAVVAYLEVPVTSVKAWAGYVNQVAASNKPPLAFVTEISVAPDATTQFKVSFKAVEAIEDGELIGALLAKADIVEQGINFPYPAPTERAAKPARRGQAARPAAKPAAKAAVKPIGPLPVRGKAPAKAAAPAEPAVGMAARKTRKF